MFEIDTIAMDIFLNLTIYHPEFKIYIHIAFTKGFDHSIFQYYKS